MEDRIEASRKAFIDAAKQSLQYFAQKKDKEAKVQEKSLPKQEDFHEYLKNFTRGRSDKEVH